MSTCNGRMTGASAFTAFSVYTHCSSRTHCKHGSAVLAAASPAPRGCWTSQRTSTSTTVVAILFPEYAPHFEHSNSPKKAGAAYTTPMIKLTVINRIDVCVLWHKEWGAWLILRKIRYEQLSSFLCFRYRPCVVSACQFSSHATRVNIIR